MSTEALLDRLLIPRPNGSEELERIAYFIETTLRGYAPEVARQAFTATPHGFQLLWAVALLLMIGFFLAVALRRYAPALLFTLLAPAMVLVEMEWLWSPVSGLLSQTEHNIAATFPGRGDGPTLVLSAHYATATYFGDHFDWYRWGWRTGPALVLALGVSLAGLWRTRRGKRLPPVAALPAAAIAIVPFAVMAWFFAAGPILRTPSPGAIDNGGSVAVLLRLAERLSHRPADASTTVQLLLFAAEEERALGSWQHASALAGDAEIVVINVTSPYLACPWPRLSWRPTKSRPVPRSFDLNDTGLACAEPDARYEELRAMDA
jgi:hypothetical protein